MDTFAIFDGKLSTERIGHIGTISVQTLAVLMYPGYRGLLKSYL